MGKNIVIVILAVIVVLEGIMLMRAKSSVSETSNQSARKVTPPSAGPNAKGRGRPIILSRGMNFKSTPLFQYAYQVAPGALSASAKKALVGFNISSQTQADGSIIVTLTPKDSEDQNQLYNVKPGQTMYFVEQTPVDDKADSDTDLNYRDDYGIIVDQNGIIQ